MKLYASEDEAYQIRIGHEIVEADEVFKLLTHFPMKNNLRTAYFPILVTLHHNPLSVLVIGEIPSDIA